MSNTVKTFDQTKPPIHVTNPKLAADQPGLDKTPFVEFPKHLHHPDGTYVAVANEAQQADKLADGYFLTPDAAKASLTEKADGAEIPPTGRKAKQAA